jgi:hypothetical protein
MKKKHQIILSILNQLKPDIALTTREIFNEMDDAEKGAFAGVDDVSKTISYIGNHKKWIDNGISEIVNGKTTLTWRITKAGLAAFNGAEPETNGAETETDDEMPSDVIDVMGSPEPTKPVLTLDPGNDMDLPFIQIISALRASYEKPDPIKIERKTQKIDTLNRLGALMSDDIRAVFEDIAADLEKLEAA